MEKEIRVTCPGCKSILIIDRVSGKILESRKPLVDDSTGDRLDDAFKKQKIDREKRDAVFSDLKGELEKRKKMSEEIFKASLEDAKKDKDVKPDSIFDLD